MQTVIYTDGSSRGNPGPGGFGAIIITGEEVKEIGGYEAETTNNRMELRAVIEALRQVKSRENIKVLADSQYVIKGITEWISGWQVKGWKNSQKKPVLNRDLWEELLMVTQGKNISWQYIEGHANHAGNERCDVIATSFADGEAVNLYIGPKSGYKVI